MSAERRGSRELVRDREWYRDLFEHAPVAYLTVDEDLFIIEANLAAAALLGRDRRALVGMSIEGLASRECRAAALDAFTQIRGGGAARRSELVLRRPDDSCFYGTLELAPSRAAGDGPSGFRLAITDVSEAKAAQAQLDGLAAIVDASEDAVIRLDPEGIITHWNRAATRMYGWSSAEAVGQSIELVVPPARRGEGMSLPDRLRRGDRIRAEEVVRRGHDGGTLEVSLSASPITDSSGNLLAVATIERDIAHRRLAELFERAPFIIAVTRGPRHVVETANAAFCDLVGEGGVVGRAMGDALVEAASGSLGAIFDDVFASEAPYVGTEVRVQVGSVAHGAPGPRSLNILCQPVRDSRGKVVGVHLQGVDVTEAVRSRGALRESANRYRALADSVPHLLWTANGKGRVDFSNKRTLEFFGGDERRSGLSWLEGVSPEDRPDVAAAWSRAAETSEDFHQVFRFRDRLRRAWRWHDVRAVPMFDKDGAVLRWFFSAIDIDDMRRAERAQKRLATELAWAADQEQHRLAEVLHDELQQLLVAIRVSLGRLARWGEAPVRYRQALQRADDLVGACVDKTRSLAHELSPPVLEREGLVPALRWLARDFRSQYEMTIDLDLDDRVDPASDSLRRMLYKAVRELLFNAVKHSGVTAATISARPLPGRIEISVTDRGVGFDASRLEALGHLSGGLGLARIRERLHHIGGDLRYSSAPGAGSSFVLEVPEEVLAGDGDPEPTNRSAL